MDILPQKRTGRNTFYGSFGGVYPTIMELNRQNLRPWQRIRWNQIIIIFLSFIGIVHYFERVKPRLVLNSCNWSKWEDWPKGSTPHHSFIYGDPQIIDDYSYQISSTSLWLFQWLADNYLHRNHQLINSVLNPHSILFVGDLFDGGREWDNEKWYIEFKRFNKIFNTVPNVRQYRQIPGNHDVGFGTGIHFDKYSRFKSYFGNANDYAVLGNHSVILMDTVSLSCSNDTRVSMESETFLEALSDSNHPSKKYPRIVLTHVPLYRFADSQTCGKFREKQVPFPLHKGKQYQTVLEFKQSQRILGGINPSIIFSGDDHDYCHIRHPLGESKGTKIDDQSIQMGKPGIKYADEVTVKSSAMTGGIKKPAIQLISMWNPMDDKTIENSWTLPKGESKVVDSMTVKTELCYLPNPMQPLRHYSICFTISILWIFVCTIPVKYGSSLNLRVNHYAKRIMNLIKRVTKTGNDINLTEIEPKRNDDKYSIIFKSIFLEWNVSKRKDWIDFFVNSFLIVIGFLLILLTYFKTI